MAVLGFDTATEDTAVCVASDGDVLYECLLGLTLEGSPGHTTRLLGEIERAVGAAGGWNRIEAIAVGLGPGSFTGLRVGIATAKGLAMGRDLRALGVCTLDALGQGLQELGGAQRPLLAILDARRGEVFAALYSETGEQLWEPWVGSPEELAERVSEMPEPPLAAGSGAIRFRGELASRGVEIPEDSDAVHRVAGRHICALAAAPGASDEPLAPIYLRAPDAERWRERDTSQRAQ